MAGFIDDIIVFSSDLDQHMKDIDLIFDRLRKANLKAKPTKCRFGTNSVKYLGHILSSEGILPNPEKIKVIVDFPVPQTPKQVRSFLGIANYYRRFIDKYSTISAPLTALLRKDAEFKWTEECSEAFEKLKIILTSPPVLVFPDLNKDFVVTTDASNKAIGYILSQSDDEGKEHPICYGGRSLRGAEYNYGIPQLECLAAVEAVSAFHPYLANRPFKLITDHQALKYMVNFKHKNARLCRWALALQGYTYTIEYKKGAANTNADGLSRRPYTDSQGISPPSNTMMEELLEGEVLTCSPVIKQPSKREQMQLAIEYQEPENELEARVSALTPEVMDLTSIPTAQQECSDFQHIYAYLHNGTLPESEQQARKTVIESEQYVLGGSILYHLFYPRSKGAPKAERMIKQLAVPKIHRLSILAQYHDGLLGGGHQGQDRTFHAIKQKYYWPGMYSNVCNYVKGCDPCQFAKRYHGFHPAPLQSMPIVNRFDRWHIDFIGPLQESPDGFKYILLITDSFSRWPEAFPTK